MRCVDIASSGNVAQGWTSFARDSIGSAPSRTSTRRSWHDAATRVFGPDLVDVAYEPWRAVRSTVLRLGPSSRAPAIRSDDGEAVELATGQHLGRQTTRNPACLDAPPLRPAVDGFVWGYGMPPATRKSGWTSLSDLEPDPTFDELACGPADADFDRRRPDACGGHCDERPLTGVRAVSGSQPVSARDVYLRYAPGSTAFRYLVRGDEVRRLIETANARWVGVEVRTARWTRRRARGWVLAGALRDPPTAVGSVRAP